MSKKDNEKDTGKRFLTELGTPVSELLTLEEFARRDPDPAFNIEHLDSICPDLVAITDAGAIGLELTAYTDDDSQNWLSDALRHLHEAGAKLADRFPELRGIYIHVLPNKDNILRQRDADPLAAQVLEFVLSKHKSAPFEAEQDRHFSARAARKSQKPFADWPKLDQYVRSITVHSRRSFQDEPAMLYGDFASPFGTRLVRLTQTIVKKAAKLKNGYSRGFSAVWLLIHADGNPRSSRIAPMWPEEIERLQNSSARQNADESGFDRVFLWDGVRGGVVEFTSPDSTLAQRA